MRRLRGSSGLSATRGAMVDCLRRSAHTTRTARRKLAAYEAALRTLRGRLKREPDRREIAEELGLSDAELRDLEASSITLTPISEEYDESSMAFASDDPDPFEALCAAEDRALLVRAMVNLPDRLKLVLQLFFVEELNLTEIAAVLEVSVPRVHQLRAKALTDLRKLLQAEMAGD
jgi:RNA polymerase sigma factor FliA